MGGEGLGPKLGDDTCQGEICHLAGPSSSLPAGLDFWGQLCPSQLRSKLVPMRLFPEEPQPHPRF